MIYALEQRLSLKCCVRGFPKPNVTWFRDGEPLSLVSLRFTLANDNQELVISRVLTDDSGNYSCMAQNIHGRSKLHNITLDIRKENNPLRDSRGQVAIVIIIVIAIVIVVIVIVIVIIIISSSIIIIVIMSQLYLIIQSISSSSGSNRSSRTL